MCNKVDPPKRKQNLFNKVDSSWPIGTAKTQIHISDSKIATTKNATENWRRQKEIQFALTRFDAHGPAGDATDRIGSEALVGRIVNVRPEFGR